MTGTTTSRTPVETVQAYLDAWNAHDGAAVVATFDESGTYVDPTLPGPIGGADLAGYVAGLATAFPDLHFAVEDLVVAGARVVLQWRMRGTNTGPLPGRRTARATYPASTSSPSPTPGSPVSSATSTRRPSPSSSDSRHSRSPHPAATPGPPGTSSGTRPCA